jgi:hypothetical protein
LLSIVYPVTMRIVNPMIKPVYNASSFSLTKWAYKKTNLEIPPEWQELISSIENADILLTLALDQNCPRRAYILKSLYFLVGTSASKHVDVDIVKINELLNKAAISTDRVILNWVNRSRVILADLRKYDYTEWCKGGFSEQDLPMVN